MRETTLDNLSDDDLHTAVRRLTARSNITLAELLAHLGEVESRGIHRNRACASLYTYCVYELRMSEDAAFRRSKAARLVHLHPELRDILARGEIHAIVSPAFCCDEDADCDPGASCAVDSNRCEPSPGP